MSDTDKKDVIIAAVSSLEKLEAAIASGCKTLFLLAGTDRPKLFLLFRRQCSFYLFLWNLR